MTAPTPTPITTAADIAVATLIEAYDDLHLAAKRVVDSAYDVEARRGYSDHTCVDDTALEELRKCL